MPRHARRLVCGLLLSLSIALPTRAQIKTDGSVGARQTLTGPAFAIPATLGRQVGGNLFHSFSDFNIQSGESATFTGPGSVQNVLSRVTGRSISTINGPLRCDIPGANLYLMNPAGVVFGPGATLDVSGSFAVTSADSIRLGKAGRFSAAAAAGEVLSSGPPTAFGFLAPRATKIELNGSQLTVGTNKALSVVANGDIRLTSSAALSAPAGRVNLVAVASAGQVGLRATDIASPLDTSVSTFGNIAAAGGALVDTSGNFGGPIVVRANNFSLDNSGLTSLTTGGSAGRTVDIRLTGDLTLGGGAGIGVNTAGGAAGGRLEINAARVAMSGGSVLAAANDGAARGGQIAIAADSISVDGSGTQLAATPIVGSTGPGGSVSLSARSISITGGATVAVATFGSGAAGEVRVRADDLLIRGTGPTDVDTGLLAGSANGAPGDGGTLDIAVKSGRLLHGGNIAGNTTGTGRGASIHLLADAFAMDDQGFMQARSLASNGGHGGSIRLDVGTLSISGDALINADTFGEGPAGDIRLNVAELSVTRGGNVAANTSGSGSGGVIDVNATRSVFIRGDTTGLQAIAQGQSSGAGNAGDVRVTTPSLDLRDGGYILSGTTGSGGGGRVTVAADAISLRRGAIIGNSAIEGSTGNGGSVAIRAGTLAITDGSLVSATVLGGGDGGSVDVRADHLLVRGNATDNTGIFTSSGENTTGSAGDITIHRSGSVTLEDGGTISVATQGSGRGGSLKVDAQSLTLDGLGTLILAGTTSASGGGPGGTLRISTDRLAVRNGAKIAVGTFGSGSGGTGRIDARAIRVTGVAGDLPEKSTTSISAGTSGSGPGGDLTVRARSIRLENGGGINVGTAGPGNGGSADVAARRIVLDRGGIIAGSQVRDPASPPATGNAGRVSVHASKALALENGAVVGAKADAADAGNITLQSPRITLRNSSISGQASGTGGSINVSAHDLLYLFRSQINAVGQQSLGSINIDPIFTILDQSSIMTTSDIAGGNINVRTDRFFKSADSVITAARNATVNLTVYTPNANITGSLVPVNAPLIDSSASFIEECSRRLQVDLSSFLITGRGGQPVEPGGLNPTFDLRNPSPAPAR